VDPRARVEAAIRQRPVDRPPAGAWGHAYRQEWSPVELAAVTVDRARRLGWDFVKFQPRASCFAEAFGSEYRPSGHSMRTPVLIRAAVGSAEDWRGLRLVNPRALEDQVEGIALTRRGLGPRVPLLQTVFSPLTVAGYLVGRSPARAVRELRSHPDLVLPALDRIAETLGDFARRSVEAGADGVFYAISGYASAERMPRDAYVELALPLDRRVLASLPEAAWFNVRHVCGSRSYLDVARQLPVQVVSWSVHNRGNPSLAEGGRISGKAVMGGLGQRTTLLRGPADSIQREVQAAVRETGGRGLLLAPGCSVPPAAGEANLKAMMEAVAA